MDTDDSDRVTQAIIGCAMRVSNTLGIGFLEKVYENSLAIELRKLRYVVEQQKPLDVMYDGQIVGEYFADMVVGETVLLELKTARAIDESHQAQLLNYLRATGLHTGLILNFGTSRLGIKRMAL